MDVRHVPDRKLENFWSSSEARIGRNVHQRGTHFHLLRYADEQAFRFNERQVTDADRFVQLCSNVAGRRLTWKQVTGKNDVERDSGAGGAAN